MPPRIETRGSSPRPSAQVVHRLAVGMPLTRQEKSMSATVLGSRDTANDGISYEVSANLVTLAIEFYRGDPEARERPWRVSVDFVREERTLSGAGPNRRSAFLAASSRQDVLVRGGIPLPAVTWSDVERALEEAGAFRNH
jgi:hypothetical protein